MASAGHRSTSWKDVAWLMLSDVVGTSVLVFPGIANKLGWLLTIFFIVALFPISLYVSVLMTRTRQLLLEMSQRRMPQGPTPRLGTMGDIAGCALESRLAATLVYIAVYGYNLLGQASYLLVLGTSLQSLFWSIPLCIPTAVAAACGVLVIPLFAIRRLGESVLLCFANTVIIAVAIVVALVHIASLDLSGCHETYLVPPGISTMTVLGQVTNVLYAFTGQWMYFELMETMSKPNDFPRAFAIAGPCMMTMYLTVALVSYALGAGHADLVSSMTKGPTLRAVAFLLFVHVVIVYVIKSVVLARYFHGLSHPQEVETRSFVSYMRHGGWGVAMLVFGYLVSNAIPFFSQLLGFIGGLLAGPINFLLPIFFYLVALGKYEADPRSEVAEDEEMVNMCEDSKKEKRAIVTEYGTCEVDEQAVEEEETGTTTTTSSGEETSTCCLVALRKMPAWELAMLACTVMLTVLTMVLGFSDQVRQILELEESLGAPFSCHELVVQNATSCPRPGHH